MNNKSTFEERLDQLECRCRNLRRILGGFVVVGAAVCLIAAAPNPAKDSIQTKTLEVVDGDGKVRVRIGPADEGFGLVVYDKNGAFQATLTDAPLGAVMQLQQGVAPQSATRSESDSEGGDTLQPESEVRSR